jgi:hypothetical protein
MTASLNHLIVFMLAKVYVIKTFLGFMLFVIIFYFLLLALHKFLEANTQFTLKMDSNVHAGPTGLK